MYVVFSNIVVLQRHVLHKISIDWLAKVQLLVCVSKLATRQQLERIYYIFNIETSHWKACVDDIAATVIIIFIIAIIVMFSY